MVTRALTPWRDVVDRRIREMLVAAVQCVDLGEDEVHLAGEVVQEVAFDDWPVADRIGLLLLPLSVLAAVRRGGTGVALSGDEPGSLHHDVSAILRQDGAAGLPVAADAVHDAITSILQHGRAPELVSEPPAIDVPLIADDGFLQSQRSWFGECRIARWVGARLREPDDRYDPAVVAATWNDLARSMPRTRTGAVLTLSDEQRLATLTALQRPLTVITGGPGTGKTSIVASILRLAVRLGVPPAEIALAAPTGKAARRLTESVRSFLEALDSGPDAVDAELSSLRARTLHGLIGWRPDVAVPRRHRNNRLPHRLIVVDEVSMADLELFDRLLAAIADEATLVLLGDADQLPSVDCGAVLADLAGPDEATSPHPGATLETSGQKSSPAPPLKTMTVRLRRSFRTASSRGGNEIHALATAIRDRRHDKIPGFLNDRRRPADSLRLDGVEFVACDNASEARKAVTAFLRATLIRRETWSTLSRRTWTITGDGAIAPDEIADLEALISMTESARVLTCTRVFALGADSLNDRLLPLFESSPARRTRAPSAGVCVMATRNDHARGIFNGDTGVCVWGRRNGGSVRRCVVFDTSAGWRAFEYGSLGAEVRTALAMTIHKSQGSEYDHVALVLPDRDVTLLSRELLYTGVTRARHSVTVIGSIDRFVTGAMRSLGRRTSLSRRLAEAVTRTID